MKDMVLSKANLSTEVMDPFLSHSKTSSLSISISMLSYPPSFKNTSPLVPIPFCCRQCSTSLLSFERLLYWLSQLKPLPSSFKPAAVRLLLSTRHRSCPVKVSSGLRVAKPNGKFSGSSLVRLSAYLLWWKLCLTHFPHLASRLLSFLMAPPTLLAPAPRESIPRAHSL